LSNKVAARRWQSDPCVSSGHQRWGTWVLDEPAGVDFSLRRTCSHSGSFGSPMALNRRASHHPMIKCHGSRGRQHRQSVSIPTEASSSSTKSPSWSPIGAHLADCIWGSLPQQRISVITQDVNVVRPSNVPNAGKALVSGHVEEDRIRTGDRCHSGK
jgi:hypothetical protein